MYGLQIRQLVIVGVDADAEEKPRVAPVDNLQVPELNEVGLMLLISRGDQAVDLAFEFDFFFITVWCVPFRQAGFTPFDPLA